MNRFDVNNDFCAECGLVGELLCCDHCPKAFHKKCLSKETRKELINGRNWKCPFCIEKRHEFTFNDVRSSTEYYRYMRIFDTDLQDSVISHSDGDYMPSIGLILLSLEWILAIDQIPAAAACVSKYFSVKRGDRLHVFNDSLQSVNMHRLVDELRKLVEPEQFDSMHAKLVLRNDALAVGMASSCRSFAKKCPHCEAFRYLRSFCFNCGCLFHIASEIAGDIHAQLSANKSMRKLSACKVPMPDSSYHSEPSRMCHILAECSGGGAAASVPIIIRSHKRRHMEEDDGAMGTKRVRKQLYSDVGLRAMRQFELLARKRSTFLDFGGDIFFLMRNLATSCIGLHRAFARRELKAVCERWMQHNPNFAHEADPNLHGTIEGIQTLGQLLDPDSRAAASLSEPDDLEMLAQLDQFLAQNPIPSTGSTLSRHMGRNRAGMSKCVAEHPTVNELSGDQKPKTDGQEHDFVDQGGQSNVLRPFASCEAVDGDNAQHLTKRVESSPWYSSWQSVAPGTIGDAQQRLFLPSPQEEEEWQQIDDDAHFAHLLLRHEESSFMVDSKPVVMSEPLRARSSRAAKMTALRAASDSAVSLDSRPMHPLLFDYEVCRQRCLAAVRDQIQFHTKGDMISLDPDELTVPLTPETHCGHCGFAEKSNGGTGSFVDKRPMSTKKSVSPSPNGSSEKIKSEFKTEESSSGRRFRLCQQCGLKIVPCVDYASLTEALCWAYLFQYVGLDVDISSKRKSGTLAKIVRMLPLVRSYGSLDTMGDNFFRLQCYFVTHLVYVFSDWGQHTLRRQLFSEEFEFIARQMVIAVQSLKDPELVGEFVHCLKILQYTDESDPELEPVVRLAMDFLVDVEDRLGRRGLFVSGNRVDEKDKYHASFCGAIGLLESTFSLDAVDRLDPPLPHVLSLI